MYKKDFDRWNEAKKRLDKEPPDSYLYFYAREIWWCTVGVNLGVEIDGKNTDFERPVLVVKKFNDFMFWGTPLSSKSKSYSTMVRIEHGFGTSYVNLAQMRLFSAKRMLRKAGMVSQKTFNELLSRLRNLLVIE